MPSPICDLGIYKIQGPVTNFITLKNDWKIECTGQKCICQTSLSTQSATNCLADYNNHIHLQI